MGWRHDRGVTPSLSVGWCHSKGGYPLYKLTSRGGAFGRVPLAFIGQNVRHDDSSMIRMVKFSRVVKQKKLLWLGVRKHTSLEKVSESFFLFFNFFEWKFYLQLEHLHYLHYWCCNYIYTYNILATYTTYTYTTYTFFFLKCLKETIPQKFSIFS